MTLGEIAKLSKPSMLKTQVFTAPKGMLTKQLAGFPYLYKTLGFNLDLRQWNQGVSKMWKAADGDTPGTDIPLRYDAIEDEWCFEYVPIKEDNDWHRRLCTARHEDLTKARGISCYTAELECAHTDKSVKALTIDLINLGLGQEFTDGERPRRLREFRCLHSDRQTVGGHIRSSSR